MNDAVIASLFSPL